MKIVVRTNEMMKDELLAQELVDHAELYWVKELSDVSHGDAYIDLLFEPTEESIQRLKKLSPAIVILNSVSTTLDNFPDNFIRINAWPTFLKRFMVEGACDDAATRARAEKIFACFAKTVEWVPDTPGFISARVISMIINEAFFALHEKVSTRAEIDLAMKLGTNYPFGPFEWSEIIGIKNIYQLLTTLSQQEPRYQPCALLKEEALNS